MPDDFGATRDTAGLLTVGSQIAGEIETSGDIDWFSVDLSFPLNDPGAGYLISAVGAGGAPLGDLQLTAYVENFAGDLVEINAANFEGARYDMQNSGSAASFKYSEREDKTLFVAVSSVSQSGGYSLTAERIEDDYPEDASTTGLIEGSGAMGGEILGNESDWIRWQPEPDTTYVIEILGDGDPSTVTLTIPFASIVNENGGAVSQVSDLEVGPNSVAFAYQSRPDPEAVFVSVIPSVGALGTYQVEVSAVGGDDYASSPETSGRLTPDADVSGRVEEAGDHDWFAADLTAGKTYFISVIEEASPFGRLTYPKIFGVFDQSADPIPSAPLETYFGHDIRELSVGSDGTYYFDIGGRYEGQVGGYSVRLFEFDDDYSSDPSNAGALSVGGTLAGRIDFNESTLGRGVLYDRDAFAVDLVQGGIYRFPVSDIDASGPRAFADRIISDGLVYPQLLAYSPTDPVRSGGNFMAQDTETHYVSVRGSYGPVTGDYEITAQAIYVPTPQEAAATLEEGPMPAFFDLIYGSFSGGAGPEGLLATDFDAVMRGRGGSDTLAGGAGDDLLIGDDALPRDFYIRSVEMAYRAYSLLLERVPDQAALDAYAGQDVYYSLGARMSESILLSPEFLQRYGEMSDAEFVDMLYTRLRGPEGTVTEEETLFYLDIVSTGISGRLRAAEGFFQSQEYRNMLDGAELDFAMEGSLSAQSDEVFASYRALLDRAPDVAGFLGWVERMASGLDLSAMIRGIMGSVEFDALGPLDDRAFAALVLENLARGSVPESEIDAAEALLARGISRSDFVAAQVLLDDDDDMKGWMRDRGVDDVLIGQSGDNILYGGLMSDRFVFNPHDEGTQTIKDFEAWDQIDLRNFGYESFEAAQAQFTQVGEDIVFEDGAARAVIEGFDLRALEASDLLL